MKQVRIPSVLHDVFGEKQPILSIVAILLFGGLIAVWMYTILGVYIVNSLKGKQSQLFVAGLLLSIGVGCIPLLPNIQTYMLITCLLFMMKVFFGFAVDHYGKPFSNNGEFV